MKRQLEPACECALPDELWAHIISGTGTFPHYYCTYLSAHNACMSWLLALRLLSRQLERVLCTTVFPLARGLGSVLEARLDDAGAALFPALTRLQLCKTLHIHHTGARTVMQNTSLTNAGLVRLTSLERLFLDDSNVAISDAGLLPLTHLKSLQLCKNSRVTDNALARLTGLESLNLAHNTSISDAGLASLTRLSRLGLWHNSRITGLALARLPVLKSLSLHACGSVDDAGLAPLAALRSLDVGRNRVITEAGLVSLTALKKLRTTGDDFQEHGFVDAFCARDGTNLYEADSCSECEAEEADVSYLQ